MPFLSSTDQSGQWHISTVNEPYIAAKLFECLQMDKVDQMWMTVDINKTINLSVPLILTYWALRQTKHGKNKAK